MMIVILMMMVEKKVLKNVKDYVALRMLLLIVIRETELIG